jgi:hypothetical protein
LDGILEEIVRRMCQRVEGGSTHGQVAVELNLRRRTVSRIVTGKRGIGLRTLFTIVEADPPWLREVLAGARAQRRGSNGKGLGKRPG